MKQLLHSQQNLYNKISFDPSTTTTTTTTNHVVPGQRANPQSVQPIKNRSLKTASPFSFSIWQQARSVFPSTKGESSFTEALPSLTDPSFSSGLPAGRWRVRGQPGECRAVGVGLLPPLRESAERPRREEATGRGKGRGQPRQHPLLAGHSFNLEGGAESGPQHLTRWPRGPSLGTEGQAGWQAAPPRRLPRKCHQLGRRAQPKRALSSWADAVPSLSPRCPFTPESSSDGARGRPCFFRDFSSFSHRGGGSPNLKGGNGASAPSLAQRCPLPQSGPGDQQGLCQSMGHSPAPPSGFQGYVDPAGAVDRTPRSHPTPPSHLSSFSGAVIRARPPETPA